MLKTSYPYPYDDDAFKSWSSAPLVNCSDSEFAARWGAIGAMGFDCGVPAGIATAQAIMANTKTILREKKKTLNIRFEKIQSRIFNC